MRLRTANNRIRVKRWKAQHGNPRYRMVVLGRIEPYVAYRRIKLHKYPKVQCKGCSTWVEEPWIQSDGYCLLC